MQNFLRALPVVACSLFFSIAQGQSISTSAVNSPVCRGSALSVPFVADGSFIGGNVFTAQLSDANGAFGSPVAIGTLNSTSSGTILAMVPSGTIAGALYRVRVISSNPVVTGADNGSDLVIHSALGLPGAIGTVGGAAMVCPGDMKTYYVPKIANAASYIWSSSSGGGTLLNQRSGLTADTIDVLFGAAMPNTYTLAVKAQNSCGQSVSRTLAILRNNPATPGAITGPVVEICAGTTGVEYSVPNTPGIYYDWSFTPPVNAVIHQTGTNTVTVDFGATWTSGSLGVTASNGTTCGLSAASKVTILSKPLTPGSIFRVGSLLKVCPGDTVTYYVQKVAGVTSYNWSVVSSGLTLINPRSSATADSIDAAYNNNLPLSIILSVKASNACGISAASSTGIFRNNPVRPGAVTGQSAEVCAGTAGSIYSVPALAEHTYVWSFTSPVDAAITQDQSNVATVDFGPGWNIGAISVAASNGTACGLSEPSQLIIDSKPGSVFKVGGNSAVCPGETFTYYIQNPTGQAVYDWSTTGSGVTMTNQRSNAEADSIDLSFDESLAGVVLSVTATSEACGTGQPKKVNISRKLPFTPTLITGPSTEVCAGNSGVVYSVPYIEGIRYYWKFTDTVDAVINQDSSNIVTIDFGPGWTTGTLGVTAYSATTCGPSSTKTLFLQSKPSVPTGLLTVGGATNVCPGDLKTYYVNYAKNTNYFLWYSESPGGTLMNQRSSLAADTIDVLYDYDLGSNFALKVTGENSCGSSNVLTLNISPNIPGIPGPISGPVGGVCASTTGVPYSVALVPNLVYQWSFQGTVDAVIHQNGSNSITVDYGPNWVSGTLAVTSFFGTCSPGGVRTLAIGSKALPPIAIFTLGGPAKVCAGDVKTYYITKREFATGYTWNISTTGGHIFNYRSSATADSISVAYDSTITASFTLSVTSDNLCGSSVPRTLGISKKTFYYPDADGDGYGSGLPVNGCSVSVGYADNNDDCNDQNADIHPNAPELCNGIDDNCSGYIDEGAKTIFYLDADSDGFGNPFVPSDSSCTAPLGYVDNRLDCDDGNGTINEGVGEICNGFDDNCDGTVDEGVMLTFYRDADEDTYGNPNDITEDCTAPDGYVDNNSDCNDFNEEMRPGATEVCNGFDDDCNGQVDEGVKSVFFRDDDGDGFGSPDVVSPPSCFPPLGYVDNNGDCNDDDNHINPGAPDICNDVDDNCNGESDESVSLVFYYDADGDGFGDAGMPFESCSPPEGYVLDNTDCDDSQVLFADSDGDGFGGGPPAACGITGNNDCNDLRNDVYPGAVEICNNVDDNCDGAVDEGVLITFYRDADGDSYGDSLNYILRCLPQAGYVLDNTDCDDTHATYIDNDDDGFGGATRAACGSLDNTDCDDSKAGVHPGATEICNELDDNCDGEIDEGVRIKFFSDLDGDGYGVPGISLEACEAPLGFASNSDDCNDSVATANPGATEICINDIDDNCDNLVDEGCCPFCVKLPVIPSTITVSGGTASVCPGNIRTYSVKALSCVAYNWTVPAGMTIIKGQGTSVITVTFNNDFLILGRDILSVRGFNVCGEGPARTLVIVKKSNPGIPGGITVTGGIPKVCPGDARTYTVAPVNEVTFSWAVPTGGYITSGQNTNSIGISFDSSFTDAGNLIVVADNGCGVSTPRTLLISRNIPALPGTVTVSGGTAAVCPGDERTYTVVALPGLSYLWTPPVGATITSGQGTNSITMLYNTDFAAASGVLMVSAVNSCGPGAPRSLTILRSIPAKTPVSIAMSGGNAAVCPGDVRTYTVALAAKTWYEWSPPEGGVILSGQGTNSIVMTFDSNFVEKDTLAVIAINGCGSSTARIIMIQRYLPPTPGNITIAGGTGTVCPGDVRTFSVAPVAGIIYKWVPPDGGIILSGQGTNSMTLTFDSSFVAKDTLFVAATNTCSISANRFAVLQRNFPAVPGVITLSGGTATVCPGDVRTYSIKAVAGITYKWTPPVGANITSGQGSDTIRVLYDTNFVAADVLSVQAENGCGISAARTLAVPRNLPALPSVITLTGGTAAVCPGDVRTYSVKAVAGITYKWMPPVGANIISGQGSDTITVLYDTDFVAAGVLSVQAENGCGISAARTLAVPRNLPAVPSVITLTGGTAAVCPGDVRVCTVVAGANVTYDWMPPVGANIISGQGTNSITLSFDGGFVATGSLKVQAVNSCGSSTARILNFTVNKPTLPGVISGPLSICKNTTHTYSITRVANATSYQWTAPAGAVIQGSSTDTSVIISFGITAGSVSVASTNGCGSSSARVAAVKITCREGDETQQAVTEELDARVYPNPTRGLATIEFNSSVQDHYLITMLDVTGREVLNRRGTTGEGLNRIELDLAFLAKGIYFIRIESADNRRQIRLVLE